MNIAENLQYLETHYIKVWIKHWQKQLEQTDSTEEREKLQKNIEKAKAEISRRQEG